jgi:uncharacterized membrane protein
MKVRIISVLCLLVVSLLFIFPPAVSAQEAEIELTTPYATLQGQSGASFEFEVTLNYMGSETLTFDLSANGPQGWTTYITPSYPKDKMIRDIMLGPESTAGNKIAVYAVPPSWLQPEPGDYEITVEAVSGDIRGTLTLIAAITAKYELSLTTSDGRLNTSATAGKDNYFTILVKNTGSSTLENISFSTDKPSAWTIELSPQGIGSLIAGGSQTVEVNIIPGAKAIAGDYEIKITANAEQSTDYVTIRVTVKTPTVWGWVGVVIIVLVVAGLAFVFMRFSRR